MTDELLKYISQRHLDKSYILKNCKLKPNSFCVPLRNLTGRGGRQERYTTQKIDGLKSKTEYGSTGCFFLNGRNKEIDEILIVEGEIDFLSIIPYAKGYNLIGLKGINNLSRCIREIEGLNKTYDIYILVDNDEAANKAIERIPYTPLHLYDVRDALSGYKDVNDAICNNSLNLSALPRRIIKLKPKPKKKFFYNDTLDTIDKINSLPAIDILEKLFPEYQRRQQGCIAENGKLTHGYKFSEVKNIVTDFSEKGRPEGKAYNIAKAKFKNPRLVFEYFKGLF